MTVTIGKINPIKTAGALRLLADRLDNDDAPDFVFIVDNEDEGTYSSAKIAYHSPFRLIGQLEDIKLNILLEEVER